MRVWTLTGTATLAALLLAGCGGGGGGGGGAVANTNTATPTNTKAHMLKVGNNSAYRVTVSDRSTATGTNATVSETANSGTFTANANLANGSAPGTTGSVSKDARSTAETRIYWDRSTTNPKQIILSKDAGSVDLTDASYGTVLYSAGSSVYVGGVYTGTLTPAASMPNNVTASYTGVFGGAAIETGVSPISARTAGLDGDVDMQADFGANRVSGRINNIVEGGILPTNVDILINGSIAGNSYSGSASMVTAGTNSTVGGSTSSTHSGSFYGPNAGEVAGALTIEASRNPGIPRFGDGSGGVAIIGAYGAKKQ